MRGVRRGTKAAAQLPIGRRGSTAALVLVVLFVLGVPFPCTAQTDVVATTANRTQPAGTSANSTQQRAVQAPKPASIQTTAAPARQPAPTASPDTAAAASAEVANASEPALSPPTVASSPAVDADHDNEFLEYGPSYFDPLEAAEYEAWLQLPPGSGPDCSRSVLMALTALANALDPVDPTQPPAWQLERSFNRNSSAKCCSWQKQLGGTNQSHPWVQCDMGSTDVVRIDVSGLNLTQAKLDRVNLEPFTSTLKHFHVNVSSLQGTLPTQWGPDHSVFSAGLHISISGNPGLVGTLPKAWAEMGKIWLEVEGSSGLTGCWPESGYEHKSVVLYAMDGSSSAPAALNDTQITLCDELGQPIPLLPESGSGTPLGAIVGGVVGGVVAAALLGLLVWLLCRRQQQHRGKVPDTLMVLPLADRLPRASGSGDLAVAIARPGVLGKSLVAMPYNSADLSMSEQGSDVLLLGHRHDKQGLNGVILTGAALPLRQQYGSQAGSWQSAGAALDAAAGGPFTAAQAARFSLEAAHHPSAPAGYGPWGVVPHTPGAAGNGMAATHAGAAADAAYTGHAPHWAAGAPAGMDTADAFAALPVVAMGGAAGAAAAQYNATLGANPFGQQTALPAHDGSTWGAPNGVAAATPGTAVPMPLVGPNLTATLSQRKERGTSEPLQAPAVDDLLPVNVVVADADYCKVFLQVLPAHGRERIRVWLLPCKEEQALTAQASVTSSTTAGISARASAGSGRGGARASSLASTGSNAVYARPSEAPPSDVDLSMDLSRDLLFPLGSHIGSGAFGKVHRALLRGSVPVAVKVLGSEAVAQRDANALVKEISILSRVRHMNVVTCYGGNPKPPHVFIVEELLECSLADMLHGGGGRRQLPLPLLLSISVDVAEGLWHIHPNIVHRDLKPGNILLTSDGVAKIADFGISGTKQLHTYLQTRNVAAGTVCYMAPECFTEEYCISEKSDIYSLAIIMWECLAGERPWAETANTMSVIYQVGTLDARPPLERLPADTPPALVSLIRGCWRRNPRERPSSAEVVRRLIMLSELLPEDAVALHRA